MTVIEIVYSRPFPMLRIPAPWTSSDVAKMMGVSSNAVSLWRQGSARPSRERLERLLLKLYPDLLPSDRMAVVMAYGHLPTYLEIQARQGIDILATFTAAGLPPYGSGTVDPTVPCDNILSHRGVRPLAGLSDSEGDL